MNYLTHLEIKYKKILPIFMLICSMFILYVSFLVGFSVNTITSLILLVVSVLMLTRNLAVITPNEIQMMNLLGTTVKRYSFTPEQIVITNNDVYIDGKKILSTWWADINIKEVRKFLLQTQDEQ
ncbi:hypothetical protein [Calothrix sp. PCC 7507]|uniref:hypothetical protein n=1 Tax=Calothrix sp. PCC 7507 TaxID=99598 RepID=UPI00029F3A40|nr:hypothetical protein [Calothrix sp. PCC 7507]AFY35188.1 hypothetical protein Cal7507_4834 [Calothrix sp. PCC 7507]